MKAEYPCDLCGSASYMPLEVARPYVGTEQVPVVCNDCGFIYVRERRSAEDVIWSWKEMYASKAYDPTLPGVRARLFYVAEWIDQHFGVAGKRFYDIGGGDRYLSNELDKRGAERTSSYEPTEHWLYPVDKIEPPFSLKRFQPRKNREEWRHFVTIVWTLENCTDAIDMLRSARDILREDGHIIVATGSRILVPPRKRMGAYFGKNPADTHCFRWSRRSLETALIHAGFKVVAENDWHQNDVLLLAAKPADARADLILSDDPKEVLAFFDKWARDWP